MARKNHPSKINRRKNGIEASTRREQDASRGHAHGLAIIATLFGKRRRKPAVQETLEEFLARGKKIRIIKHPS